MKCPSCSSENLVENNSETFFTTGAKYVCTDCGEAINEDGTNNMFLPNKIGEVIESFLDDNEGETALVGAVNPTPVIGGRNQNDSFNC